MLEFTLLVLEFLLLKRPPVYWQVCRLFKWYGSAFIHVFIGAIDSLCACVTKLAALNTWSIYWHSNTLSTFGRRVPILVRIDALGVSPHFFLVSTSSHRHWPSVFCFVAQFCAVRLVKSPCTRTCYIQILTIWPLLELFDDRMNRQAGSHQATNTETLVSFCFYPIPGNMRLSKADVSLG